MRMFAGPNGSGKSELKKHLPSELLGIYLNPDEVEKEIRQQGFLDFKKAGIVADKTEVLAFFSNSSFLQSVGLGDAVRSLTFEEGRLGLQGATMNSYFASVTVDYLRQKLIEKQASFTFETVMSHPGKVDLLKQAKRMGYRTYLYFIATDDPTINKSRVLNRVSRGGHAVPEDKIEERYFRSLDLLVEAIRHTNRAYVFDNSNEDMDHTWLAEITDGQQLEIKTDKVPAWFKRAVLDKIQ